MGCTVECGFVVAIIVTIIVDKDQNEDEKKMKMFDRNGVSLMCFWAWHFKWPDKTFNATSASQPKIVELVKEISGTYSN